MKIVYLLYKSWNGYDIYKYMKQGNKPTSEHF